MDGIHDMGGMHGFGKVLVKADEPVFHERWEARVFAIRMLASMFGANIDYFRHQVESTPPHLYLTRGYWWRWLIALESDLVACGVMGSGEVEARAHGFQGASWRDALPVGATKRLNPLARRSISAEPRFGVGEQVRAKNLHTRGHTRLPRYVRGHVGTVIAQHGAWVFPDTHAHGGGENPQHVYGVRFEARELWGSEAEPESSVCVDLFESYLEPL